MKNKIELLAPVGDFERGVIALNYGADAIYLGGQKFSLRSRASNFDFNEIKKIVNYAHQINKKIYFVINILCNNELITQFKAYIKQLEKLKIDGYICADPFIISYLSVNYPNKDVHISTQQSISNSKAALFFKRNKATRIVCAREISFSNLKLLKENIGNQLELEYFVHGALCISYSGQCMLSNYFCLRNANIGRCAQSCR
jgi:putative protease